MKYSELSKKSQLRACRDYIRVFSRKRNYNEKTLEIVHDILITFSFNYNRNGVNLKEKKNGNN